MLLLGVIIAQELLAAPVPADVLRQAQSDHRVDQLADEVWQLLCESRAHPESAEEFGSFPHDLFHLRTRDRLRDQLHYLFHRLTTPSRPESWMLIPAGRRMIAIHAIVRPLQVLAKLGPAIWSYFWRGHHGVNR
jgi:hypothetical protein